MNKIKKEELFSIPNCMGYFRILLIPVFCVVYLQADTMKDYYVAAAIVAVSTITDLLDGKVARKFNMITEFGKFLDPFADKLTHAAIALCLAVRYTSMRYLVLLMLVKEGFMAVMGLINLRRGKKLDGAKWFGKVCTATLFLVLCVLVLLPGISVKTVNFLVTFRKVSVNIKTVNFLVYSEMVIMAVTLLLYIPEFWRMRKC